MFDRIALAAVQSMQATQNGHEERLISLLVGWVMAWDASLPQALRTIYLQINMFPGIT